MFRALYKYKTDIKQYLTFEVGDQFTVLEKTHADWYLAQNGFGEIGYIPTNYIVEEQVTETEVLKSIDRAIEVIHYEASSSGGQYSHTQRENLNKLIQHRKNVIESYRGPAAAAQSPGVTAQSPGVTVCSITHDIKVIGGGSEQRRSWSVKRSAPAPPAGSSDLPSHSRSSSQYGHAGSSSQQDYAGEHQPYNHINHASNQEQSVGNVAEDIPSVSSHVPNKSSCRPNHTPDSITTTVSIAADKVDCATSPVFSPSKRRASSSKNSSQDQSSIVDCRTIPIPSNMGSELVEEVRRSTGLSYQKSGVAVETVLGHIGLRIPEMAELFDRMCETFHQNESSKADEETSSDYERLHELFSELTACKDDSQQRGWALHEDETGITNNLEELLSILENAKQSVSRKALARDSYESVHMLVQYYQMETRVKLRLLLLRVFGAMCTLDRAVISLLLCSILTTELADELQGNVDDVQRSSYVALVLNMLFATGESVPANLHDHLNKDFIRFVFDTIESPPSLDYEESLTDLLVSLLLAFNLHLAIRGDNLVMQVMGEKRTVKVFTEKLLLLFNRDEDPVRMFDHEPFPPNSMMKILLDMYSDSQTASILYTNDAKVLIDIILRHLIDLSPGDKDRTSHLRLMQLYLSTSEYAEHQHRFGELKECLHRIQCEEEETGEDKTIVAEILSQSQLFSS